MREREPTDRVRRPADELGPGQRGAGRRDGEVEEAARPGDRLDPEPGREVGADGGADDSHRVLAGAVY